MKKKSIPSHVLDAVALVNNYMVHNKVHEIQEYEIWITRNVTGLVGTKFKSITPNKNTCGFCDKDGGPCKNKVAFELVRIDQRFGNHICSFHAKDYINDGKHTLKPLPTTPKRKGKG